jgi:hypothetical protein
MRTVGAGENRGRELRHGFVVLALRSAPVVCRHGHAVRVKRGALSAVGDIPHFPKLKEHI